MDLLHGAEGKPARRVRYQIIGKTKTVSQIGLFIVVSRDTDLA